MSLTTSSSLQLSDFDYHLPPELIARYPLARREDSRMLRVNRQSGIVRHYHFLDLVTLLNPGDLLVLNNTKVIPARLQGTKVGHTAQVELFLMHSEDAERHQWQVLMKPAKRLHPGTQVRFENSPLIATVLERLDGGRGRVQLDWPDTEDFDSILAQTGTLPIPPYLERSPEALDNERYQTVFAKAPGAQAAPTAGLHFTPDVLDQLQQHGVQIAEVTLHVSAGTFRPVLSEDIAQHRMDPEYYTIPVEAANAIAATQAAGNRVVAIGTTVAKTLETSALNHQGRVVAESAWSELFIQPSFQFQVTDALLTNFHLPKSTLLMLVSAFSSRDLILSAYQESIAQRYRFYSYGDCMLIC